MAEAKFTWIPFYKELAKKVLEYKDKRKDLMKIVYSLPEKYTSFLQYRFLKILFTKKSFTQMLLYTIEIRY